MKIIIRKYKSVSKVKERLSCATGLLAHGLIFALVMFGWTHLVILS